MSSSKLQITSRQDRGSTACRKMRTQGLVPAVIYGHQQQALPVSISEHDLELLLVHGARLLDISLDSKPEKVLVKDVQYDHLGAHIVHVDLIRVSLDEKIRLAIPIKLRGAMDAASHGGVVEQILTEVEVECLAGNIPENLQVQIGRLKLGDSIRVKDLSLPAGATMLSDQEALVVTVRAVEAEEVVAPVEAEAAAAEPEVISRAVEEESKDKDKDKDKDKGKDKDKDKGKEQED